MAKITETLTGSLAFGSPDDRLAYLISRINERIKPPKPATGDNVNIRAMYLVNDRVNSHGGRFNEAGLSRICAMIPDTPILVGHNRAGEPLARTFHAELDEKDGIIWLKSYFYWPKADSADEFRDKIDSGVFKECSISFTYTYPECSLCGEDIRRCPHEPELSSPAEDKPHFIYRGITQVLETSLVYKGSVRGTHITDRLIAGSDRIIVGTAERQQEFSVPRGLSSEHVTIYPMGDGGRGQRVVSAPAGVLAAVATMGGKPFLLIHLA